MEYDYTILFEKLDEAKAEMHLTQADASAVELDEIAELTRVVLEINRPTPVLYTTA
jgi:hypothetical protein